jgi:hypothetical protein
MHSHGGADGISPEAVEFIRFCYRRRGLGWPELYDEMCHVASRRLFRGWGLGELADRGIGFSLFETPRLAAMVDTVVREERSGPEAAGVRAAGYRPEVAPAG